MYVINHINLIFIINYYILNSKKNNNIYKIIIIILLALGYYIINSCIFIIDAIAIVISPIIKKYSDNEENEKDKKKKYNESKSLNHEEKLKVESLRVYNRLTFLFLLSILIFSVFQVGYINYDFVGKYYKELVDNINGLFNEAQEKKIFEGKEGIELYILSKLL
jgi:hypothetical protein